ncbi:hypothetical protein LTS02_017835 [Friedmanniomyces endolithicus]|nr:hypothetical protein LTS02_017835 [Friedmanniomyces endolithicus]
MLQRTLARAAAQQALLFSSTLSSARCTCACGKLIRAPQAQQRRAAASSGRTGGHTRAPTTRDKSRRETARVLTRDGIEAKRELEEFQRTFLYKTYADFIRESPSLNSYVTAEAAVEFVNDFAELAPETAWGKNVAEVGRFKALVEEHGFPMNIVSALALPLAKLLFTLSACGDEEVTIRICSHGLLGHKAHPNLPQSSEINYTRGHLCEAARKGTNYRAMVLEGKIAYALGDEDYAIQSSGAMQWLQQSLRASEKQQREREVESLILPYYKNRDSGI